MTSKEREKHKKRLNKVGYTTIDVGNIFKSLFRIYKTTELLMQHHIYHIHTSFATFFQISNEFTRRKSPYKTWTEWFALRNTMKCAKTKQSVIIDLRRDLPRWNPANRSVLYPCLTRPFSDDDDDGDDDDAFLEISHKPKNMETDRNEKTPDQEERVWSSETHTHAHTRARTHTRTHGTIEPQKIHSAW